MKCKKRKEEYVKAAISYWQDRNFDSEVDKGVQDVFCDAVKWADLNPCLDEYFHPATEKPIEGRSILQFSMGGWYVDNYNPKYDGSWFNYVREYKVKGWIYTDDITNTITKLKDDNSGN